MKSDFLKPAFNALAQFGRHNHLKTYELDGRQEWVISLFAAGKIATLSAQLKSAFPSLGKAKVSIPLSFLPPLCIYGILKLGKACDEYLLRQEDEKPSFRNNLAKIGSRSGSIAGSSLNNFSDLSHLASVVSYVALYRLGYKQEALIALFGSLLIEAKRQKALPDKVENLIYNSYPLLQSLSFLNGNNPSWLKALELFDLLCTYYNLLHNYTSRSLTLDEGGIAKRGIHKQCETKNIASFLEQKDDFNKWKNFLDNANTNFYVNFSHIYNDMVDKVLPVKSCDTPKQELLDRLETKINDKNIILSDPQREGLKKIKNGILYGQFEGRALQNAENFQKLMGELIFSILNDETGFEYKIEILADSGNKCPDRWLAELSLLLYHKEASIEFFVHQELAKYRTFLIQDSIMRYPGDWFKSVGGVNNVHLHQAFERVHAYRFRSFNGIVETKLKGTSLFERVIRMAEKWLDASYRRPLERSFTAEVNDSLIFAVLYPTMDRALVTTKQELFQELSKYCIINFEVSYSRNPENLINHIYDAIKTQYSPNSKGEIEKTRKIQLDSVLGWMSTFQSRHQEFPLLENYDSFVLRDNYGEPYLSKALITVLLWDMGIVEPC